MVASRRALSDLATKNRFDCRKVKEIDFHLHWLKGQERGLLVSLFSEC
jgi:hypothetical protein